MLVKSQTTKIESFERTIKRLEAAGNAKDDPAVNELRERVEQTEKELREALDKFGATTKSLASLAKQLDERSKEFSLVALEARALNDKTAELSKRNAKEMLAIRADTLKRTHSIAKSLDSQSRELSSLKKSQGDLLKKLKDGIRFRRNSSNNNALDRSGRSGGNQVER